MDGLKRQNGTSLVRRVGNCQVLVEKASCGGTGTCGMLFKSPGKFKCSFLKRSSRSWFPCGRKQVLAREYKAIRMGHLPEDSDDCNAHAFGMWQHFQILKCARDWMPCMLADCWQTHGATTPTSMHKFYFLILLSADRAGFG